MSAIIVHVQGPAFPGGDVVEFHDVDGEMLPPLFQGPSGDVVMPDRYCGLRVLKAEDFHWYDQQGQELSDGLAPGGRVLVDWEDAEQVEDYLGGIEFTGPLQTCPAALAQPGQNPWRFLPPLTLDGIGLPPNAATLVIGLSQHSRLQFIDKAFAYVPLPYDESALEVGAWDDLCSRFPEFCQEYGDGLCKNFPSSDWCQGRGIGQEPEGASAWRFAEFSEHGETGPLDERGYNTLTKDLAEQGLRPSYFNFYNNNDSSVGVNVLYKRATGRWLARHDLSGHEYQELFDKHVLQGNYSVDHLESYVRAGELRYAVVLVERPFLLPFRTYHGVRSEQHQRMFEDLTKRGFTPNGISVSSLDGDLRYAAHYGKNLVGRYAVRSRMSRQQLVAFLQEQRNAGSGEAYLRAYQHRQRTLYTLICRSDIDPKSRAVLHQLSGGELRDAIVEWQGRNFEPRMVSTTAREGRLEHAVLFQRRPRPARDVVVDGVLQQQRRPES